jgi:hypothetical protein
LHKKYVFLALWTLWGAVIAGADAWYVSNAAGMAVTPSFSYLATIRNKYALHVEESDPDRVPKRLRQYYQKGEDIELRTLYEKGKISREQWTFRLSDPQTGMDKVLMVSVLKDDGAGFIELYNKDQLITESRRLDGKGGDDLVRYTYKGSVLLKAEFSHKGKALYTDNYRYSRFGALRKVERVFARGKKAPVPEYFSTVVLEVGKRGDFIRPAEGANSEFFDDVVTPSGGHILYTTDDRGRIVRQVHKNAKGEITGELVNNWSGDRLMSVEWTRGKNKRLVKYEYNADGDRTLESDYRNGVLERTVRKDGDKNVEELYVKGQVLLRAIWEGGKKISEERIRPRSGTLTEDDQ